jgi:hypothetical protein
MSKAHPPTTHNHAVKAARTPANRSRRRRSIAARLGFGRDEPKAQLSSYTSYSRDSMSTDISQRLSAASQLCMTETNTTYSNPTTTTTTTPSLSTSLSIPAAGTSTKGAPPDVDHDALHFFPVMASASNTDSHGVHANVMVSQDGKLRIMNRITSKVMHELYLYDITVLFHESIEGEVSEEGPTTTTTKAGPVRHSITLTFTSGFQITLDFNSLLSKNNFCTSCRALRSSGTLQQLQNIVVVNEKKEKHTEKKKEEEEEEEEEEE